MQTACVCLLTGVNAEDAAQDEDEDEGKAGSTAEGHDDLDDLLDSPTNKAGSKAEGHDDLDDLLDSPTNKAGSTVPAETPKSAAKGKAAGLLSAMMDSEVPYEHT